MPILLLGDFNCEAAVQEVLSVIGLTVAEKKLQLLISITSK